MWSRNSQKNDVRASHNTSDNRLPPVIKLKPEHGNATGRTASQTTSVAPTSFFASHTSSKANSVPPASEPTRTNPAGTFFSNTSVKGISQRGRAMFAPQPNLPQASVFQDLALEKSIYSLHAPSMSNSMCGSFGGFSRGRANFASRNGDSDVIYVTKMSDFRNDLNRVTSDSDFTQRYNDYWQEMESAYASESGFFSHQQESEEGSKEVSEEEEQQKQQNPETAVASITSDHLEPPSHESEVAVGKHADEQQPSLERHITTTPVKPDTDAVVEPNVSQVTLVGVGVPATMPDDASMADANLTHAEENKLEQDVEPKEDTEATAANAEDADADAEDADANAEDADANAEDADADAAANERSPHSAEGSSETTLSADPAEADVSTDDAAKQRASPCIHTPDQKEADQNADDTATRVAKEAEDDIPTLRTKSAIQLPTLARSAAESGDSLEQNANTATAADAACTSPSSLNQHNPTGTTTTKVPTLPSLSNDTAVAPEVRTRPTSMFMTAVNRNGSTNNGVTGAGSPTPAVERNHRPRLASRRPSRPLSRATSINAVDIPEAEELPDDLMSAVLEDSALLREKEEREREIEAGRAAMREARESERRAHEEAVQKAQQQLEQQQRERRAQREKEQQTRKEQQAHRDEERRRRRELEATKRTQSLEEQRRRFQEETRAEEERVAARLRAAAEERQRQLELGLTSGSGSNVASAAVTPNARRRSSTSATEVSPSIKHTKQQEERHPQQVQNGDDAASDGAVNSPPANTPKQESLKHESSAGQAAPGAAHTHDKSPFSAASASSSSHEDEVNFIQTVLLRTPQQLADEAPTVRPTGGVSSQNSSSAAAAAAADAGSAEKMTVHVLDNEYSVTEVLPYIATDASSNDLLRTDDKSALSSVHSRTLRGVQKALCSGYNAALLCTEAPGTTTCFRSAAWPAFIETLDSVLRANKLNGEQQNAKLDITCALGYMLKDGVKDLFREDNAGAFEPVSVHASPIYGPRIKQLTYVPVTRIENFRVMLDSAIRRAEANESTASQTEGVLVAFVLLKQVLKKQEGLDVFLSSFVVASSGGDVFPFDCALGRMHNVYGAAFHLVLGGPCLTCFVLNASAPDSEMHKDTETTERTDALLQLLTKLSTAKNYTMRSGSVRRFVKYLEKAQKQGGEAVAHEKDEGRRKKLQRYMDEQQRLLEGALKMLQEIE